MNKFSLTQGSILFMVLTPVLMKIGFSEVCANEFMLLIPVLLGGIGAWIGRYRAGGVNVLGFKS